jgi:hypothetical protein
MSSNQSCRRLTANLENPMGQRKRSHEEKQRQKAKRAMKRRRRALRHDGALRQAIHSAEQHLMADF